MVGRIVGSDQLQRVPGEVVATVVIHRLNRRHGEEPHGLTESQPGDQECNARSSGIQQKTFNGMIVQGPKSIRYIEAVVA